MVNKFTVQQIAKLIRLPDETWKSAMKRAKNIKKNSPKYRPERWTKSNHLQHPHNCYTYFLNRIEPSLTQACANTDCQPKNSLKPQPGYKAGYSFNKNHTCKNVSKRMLKDNPYMYKTTLRKDCKGGDYMGALAVMPGSTYHYYRRDNTGFWSHKDGASAPGLKDAKGEYILDPAKADRRYPHRKKDGKVIDYSDFCGYFCVPKERNKKYWKSRPYPKGHKRSRHKLKNKSQKKKGGKPPPQEPPQDPQSIPIQPVIQPQSSPQNPPPLVLPPQPPPQPQQGQHAGRKKRKTRRKKRKRRRRTRKRRRRKKH